MKRDFETAIVDIFSLGFLLCGLGVSGGGDFWFRFNISPKLHKNKKNEKKKIKETNNLNDMVFEANVLFLLSASVLYVEYTDEISSPASKESVENLKQDAWKHTHLREWIGQSQENLSNLYNTRADIKKIVHFSIPRNENFWSWGVRGGTWLEAQLNQASQAEPPCQRKLFMLSMECCCCCSSSLPSSLPPPSCSVSLKLETIASSACFCGNIVFVFSQKPTSKSWRIWNI